MHLVYLDDSSDNSDFQIVCAVILPESEFRAIEGFMGHMIDEYVPEEMRRDFEFHASKLFHQKDEFSKIERDQALEIFDGCVSILDAEDSVTVVYGAVNLRELRRSFYATAHPMDVAFRLCMDGIEAWFKQADLPREEIGILICDDTTNQHIKKNLQQAYRSFRGRFKRWKDKQPDPVSCFHDDIYFGDSAYSIGIQLADIYAFLILRHLEGMEDTEFLYERIEEHTFAAKLEPEGRIPPVRHNDARPNFCTSEPDRGAVGGAVADKSEKAGDQEVFRRQPGVPTERIVLQSRTAAMRHEPRVLSRGRANSVWISQLAAKRPENIRSG